MDTAQSNRVITNLLDQIEELKRDVDIFINSFLKQEGVEHEKEAFLQGLRDNCNQLEGELPRELRVVKLYGKDKPKPKPPPQPPAEPKPQEPEPPKEPAPEAQKKKMMLMRKLKATAKRSRPQTYVLFSPRGGAASPSGLQLPAK